MIIEEIDVKHVLIVDDLLPQRLALKKGIQSAIPRSVFFQATNLGEAVRIIKGSDPIDIAIIDLVLTPDKPDRMEGVEIIKTIRNEPHRKNTPTILISAYTKEEREARVKDAKADGYISKLDDSVTVELQEMIKKLLARAKVINGNNTKVITAANILSQIGEPDKDIPIMREAMRRDDLSKEAKDALERAIKDLEKKRKA